MKNKKFSFLAKPVLLLSAAALLLLGSTVGSTRAALTYYSDNYTAEVSVSSIGVSLLENGEVISQRNYNHKNDEWNETSGTLLKALAEEEAIVPGKTYNEAISVSNSGSIDSYVRVILTKSWMNKEGVKDTSLSPDLIQLNFLTENGWIIDTESSTPERTVLYYANALSVGQSTPALSDTVKIDSSVAQKVTQTKRTENGYEVITTTYDYDGYYFQLEAEVDAVQTHNAEDAIKSAWGVDVSVSNGILSLG